ncbi:MAG: S-layer homology domain-containing protein [Clostridiales bacterium]|nr:S-layer homology domain-containing protein [Clostridiales bacterium]
MKKIISVVVVCIMVFSLIQVQGAYSSTEVTAEMPVGDGTYENPFLINTDEQFNEVLKEIKPKAGDSMAVYFYQVSGGVKPLRESDDDFTFAEIVFKNYDTVIKDAIYCVLTSFKKTSEFALNRGYNFNVPVPGGYKYKRQDFVRFDDTGDALIEAYTPNKLKPGLNTVQVFEDLTPEKAGDYFIINTQKEWDYLSSGAGFAYLAKKDFNIEGGRNPYWVDLKISDTQTWRLGHYTEYPNGGHPPAPILYWAFVLPYGSTVNGQNTIVVTDNKDILPPELKGLPQFNIGDTVTVDKKTTPPGSDSSTNSTPKPSVTTQPASVTTKSPAKVEFNDIKADDWFADAIMFLAEKGIMQGNGKSAMPRSAVRRADFMILIMRAYNIELDTSPTNNFMDVPADAYFAPYLATAKRLGFARGGLDGKFRPNESITRQDMCVMLYNVLKETNNLPQVASQSAVTDPEISDYAVEAMIYLAQCNIIQGTGNGLVPKEITTRAQAAQILYNLLLT